MVDPGSADMAEGRPTTARLQSVLNRAARVVLVEGPPDQVDSTDLARTVVTGADISYLARLLAIVDGGTGDSCRCSGWPTLLIHDADDELIACWTLHHQDSIRSVGDCDADLRDGPALTAWLAERGLTGSQQATAELAAQDARDQQRRMRWMQAAPPGLAEAATAVALRPEDDPVAWSHRIQAAEVHLAALTRRRYRDGIERVRVLLAWAGLPARESGGGLHWYELAVQQLLLAEPAELIFAALTAQPPSLAQLDGAANLFGCLEWTTAHGKRLPPSLTSMLVAHIQADGTGPMRTRLEWGYYGTERSV